MVNEDLIARIVKAVFAELNADKEPEKIESVNKVTKNDEEEIAEFSNIEEQDRLKVPMPKNEKALRSFLKSTDARIGVWRVGDRPLTGSLLKFRADHAAAVDAVFNDVSEELVDRLGVVKIQTMVKDRDEFLTRPDLGRMIDETVRKELMEKCKIKPQLQVIIADGLSSRAIEANIEDLLHALSQGLDICGVEQGTPVFVKYGRVGVMDIIGETLNAEAAIIFIGERPGLTTSESMSAYISYKPDRANEESNRTVLSNIHRGGTPPAEAGACIATVVKKILDKKASGINLKD
ncbi:MAG TPA: ethanolamine ammonia-lyase subunit EutC [Clostridiaceae bacterium]|jgi:ethanolamine ammonia-lyase small subunit|nr:ethanolamine ammonia-lyase subunit EutC [Clostridiaceae bacterium]